MSENTDKKVITRFAPSPTGFMHVGGVRTAIFAWLWAKKNDGEFILRIEDTDKEREVEGSIDHIQKSLTWLGLDWDQGPKVGGPHGSYIQSERLPLYKRYAEELIQKGFAYPDPYSKEELEAFRKKAEEDKKPFLYRDHRPETFGEWDGTKPLRFKTPQIKRYDWKDLVFGDLSAGEEALDDFILIKSDGYPTYNFAHIIDDIDMGVTHVMRGQEFISSTPKFLSLYEALGVTPPAFVTLPPILGIDAKKKLSKRDGAKDLLDYEKEGYLPGAMVNFLALMGWHPAGDKEVFNVSDLIEEFDLEHIQKGGAQLGEDKLDWLNKEHMKIMSLEERNAEIAKRLPQVSKDLLEKISSVIFDHISKWGDINTGVETGEWSYFFEAPKVESELLSNKGKIYTEKVKKHLEWIKNTLENSSEKDFSSAESVKAIIFDYATEQGRGDVLWPLRVALSGKEKSPDPFTLLYILGKEESILRVNNALQA